MAYGTAALVARFDDGTTQVAQNCGHDVRLALVSRDGELVVKPGTDPERSSRIGEARDF
jgi:hypothetical protein